MRYNSAMKLHTLRVVTVAAGAALFMPVFAQAGSITPENPTPRTVPAISLTIGGFGVSELERLAQQLQLQVSALLMQVQQIHINQTASAANFVPAAGAGRPDPALTGGSVKGASTVNCPVFTRTLKFESRGEDVQTLQSFLYDQGFLTHEDVTGYYGYLTEAAVQAYQLKRGILSGGDPVSNGYGVAGKATQKFIFTVCTGSDQ